MDLFSVPVRVLKEWLLKWYYPYLNTTWNDTLLMVTFDEDSYSADDGSGTNEGNHVYAILKHPCINNGTNATKFNHYSITSFLENNFFLGSLGKNDATVNNFGAILTHKATCPNESWAVSWIPQDEETPEAAQPVFPHMGVYSALLISATAFLCIVAMGVCAYWVYRSQVRKSEVDYDILLGAKQIETQNYGTSKSLMENPFANTP